MSTAAQITSLPTGTWQLDPVHSSIGFEVEYIVGAFRGQFRDVEATLDADTGALTGAARVASVDVKDENLAAHLQSPEFFDAEQHPEIRFESTDIAVDGPNVTVTGDLTIKGHTERVTAQGSVVGPIEDPFGNTKLGLQLETVVDRTKFGLNWNADMPKGGRVLANDVKLHVELELLKQV